MDLNSGFKTFLSKLDLRYLPHSKKSFLNYAKQDIDHWYKKPLRFVLNRIATLENNRTKIYPEHKTVAKATDITAWAGNTFLQDKIGLQIMPLAIPDNEKKKYFALKLIPTEIASDLKNGGISFAYHAFWYKDLGFFDGVQFKGAYILSDETSDFLRADLNALRHYDDFMTYGAGISFFGDTQGAFYKRDSAFGFNAYVDFVDIFRFTYVHRNENRGNRNYFYFGIENIPSLFYWLKQ